MSNNLVFLSIPGLRERDLPSMPGLERLVVRGSQSRLQGSFPCVTWPAQATLLTGKSPRDHGVVSNGFYWRDKDQIEMWTAWNDKIAAPQIWDSLKTIDPQLTSAVWFPMLSKGCGADFVCMPAPIHNPDGSESLWCYTKPTEFYGVLRDALGHFPLKHFWGPIAGIPSTKWIVDSAIVAAKRFQPNFFYLYLPHLDYAAQKYGPDSAEALQALAELDTVVASLGEGMEQAYGESPVWMVASEYTIQSVNHVTYPNRILRQAGLLDVLASDEGELLDTANSRAWCLVDHQFSHVFVRDGDAQTLGLVADLFSDAEGFDRVLVGDQRAEYGLDHERSGEIVLVSTANSWQAYYYWTEDSRAPGFSRTVDIHRKPGYDPVELCFDIKTKSIPLDATLIQGSHGVPLERKNNQSVLLSSEASIFSESEIRDVDVAHGILRWFGK